MLEHYYDLNTAAQFDKLFGDTYIGQNPTPLKNSYPILKFNFSMVSTDGTIDDIKHSFFLNILNALSLFKNKYEALYNFDPLVIQEMKQEKNPSDVFMVFQREMKIKNVSFYLIIDEFYVD